MPVYLPRMSATLDVPTLGDAATRVSQNTDSNTYRLVLRPIRARLMSNGPNEADELELTVSFDEAGVDPRYLRSGIVQFFLADTASSGGVLTPGLGTNCRFIGMVVDVTREFKEDAGKIVTLRAQDYTCLFLACKTYPASKWPTYSDTLQSAWQKVCANTGFWDLSSSPPVVQSTVSVLADQLVFIGANGVEDPSMLQTPLGKSMPSRLAGLGTFQAGRPGDSQADSWEIWKTVCESLGLITFIRNDRVIVTGVTDFFTAADPPLFIYGKNVLELKETRELGQVSAKNVCVRSFDPLSGKTLEALFPPAGLAIKQKRLGASPKSAGSTSTGSKVVNSECYELLDLPTPCADQDTLQAIAERIWQERVRQELSGTLTTREMSMASASGQQQYDLLALSAGDQIQIQIDPAALDAIQKLPSIGQRVQALMNKGYASDIANFIAENLSSITSLPAQFLCHSIETTIDATSLAGILQREYPLPEPREPDGRR